MQERKNTFPKKEHLSGEMEIEKVYREGEYLFCFPYKVVVCLAREKEREALRILVNVPKKRFKHAVDRNRGRRQIREVYRLNKHALRDYLTEQGLHLYVAIHYVGEKLETTAFLEKKMVLLLDKVKKKVEQKEFKFLSSVKEIKGGGDERAVEV